MGIRSVLTKHTIHKCVIPPALYKTVSGHDLLFWNGLSTIWHLKMKWVEVKLLVQSIPERQQVMN